MSGFGKWKNSAAPSGLAEFEFDGLRLPKSKADHERREAEIDEELRARLSERRLKSEMSEAEFRKTYRLTDAATFHRCEMCAIGVWLTENTNVPPGVKFVCGMCTRARENAEAKKLLRSSLEDGSKLEEDFARAIIGSELLTTAYSVGDVRVLPGDSTLEVREKIANWLAQDPGVNGVTFLPADAEVRVIEPKSPIPYTNDAEARARAEFAWRAVQAWWSERHVGTFGGTPSLTFAGWDLLKCFQRCIVAIWDTSDDATTARDRVLRLPDMSEAIAKQVLRAYEGWTR